jgi:hypothetical protein
VRALVAAAAWEYEYALTYNQSRGLKANVGFLLSDAATTLATALPVALAPATAAPAGSGGDVAVPAGQPVRFALFSGHDTGPVGPLLAAFGALQNEWPAYASLVVLEAWAPPSSADSNFFTSTARTPSAHSADSGAFVRALFQGRVLPVPGCNATEPEGLCPLADFLKFVAAWAPTEAECAPLAPSAASAATPSAASRRRLSTRVPRATE